MKDEIKEKMTIGKAKKILRGFLEKDCYYDTPLYYAIPYLLDYITNLQEENKNLKQINEEHRKINGNLRKTINEAIDYLEYQISQLDFEKDTKAKMLGSMVLVLLQGSDE